jgi:hypothetical protein
MLGSSVLKKELSCYFGSHLMWSLWDR